MNDQTPLGAQHQTIVDPQGQPARKAIDTTCPKCGAPKEKRRPSSGFGVPYPLCGICGYEWTDEVWRG